MLNSLGTLQGGSGSYSHCDRAPAGVADADEIDAASQRVPSARPKKAPNEPGDAGIDATPSNRAQAGGVAQAILAEGTRGRRKCDRSRDPGSQWNSLAAPRERLPHSGSVRRPGSNGGAFTGDRKAPHRPAPLRACTIPSSKRRYVAAQHAPVWRGFGATHNSGKHCPPLGAWKRRHACRYGWRAKSAHMALFS